MYSNMQITIEIPDEIMLELNQTSSSIQKYTFKGDRLLQTETWKLCGSLRINKEEEISNNLDVVTNYAETIY
jgi:hypothetical protein